MTAFRETLLFQQNNRQQVPSWLVGTWKRLSIEENNSRDDTTQVYWLQTNSCFGDIRIPADRPTVEAFEDLAAREAIALSHQDGFVGVTRLKNDICHWHHAMDYCTADTQADTGKLYWEGDILVEVGPDEAYVEKWQRISTGPTAAMTLSDRSGWQGWLVVCGNQFIYMRSHSQAVSKRPEISMGRIRHRSARWEIQLSTQPWKEGSCLWKPEEMTIDEDQQKIIQTTEEETVAWTVREWGELASLFESAHTPALNAHRKDLLIGSFS